MNRIAPAIFLVCAAAALDCWYFPGTPGVLHKVEFTTCLVAAVAIFAPEAAAVAACFAGGLILDALNEKVLYLPLFFALMYSIRGIGSMFYKPGSVFHVAGATLFLLAAIGVKVCFVFMRSGEWIPLSALWGSLILNAAVFWCFAALIHSYFAEARHAPHRI